MAAHRSSLCLYLSAKHIEQVESKLLLHYPPQTPVAICFRLGWKDEKIVLVALSELRIKNEELGMVRSTLYVISPALMTNTVPKEFGYAERSEFSQEVGRSQLYSSNLESGLLSLLVQDYS